MTSEPASVAHMERRASPMARTPAAILIPSTNIGIFGSNAGVADRVLQGLRRRHPTSSSKAAQIEPGDALITVDTRALNNSELVQ